MSDRGQRVLAWAADVFGPVATDRRERAVRLVEEAIEVAQAEGVPAEVVERVVRPAPAEIEYFDIAGALRAIDEERQRHSPGCPRRTGFATCSCSAYAADLEKVVST